MYDAFGHLVGEYAYSGTSLASYQEHIWLGDTPIANMRNGVTSPLYVLADHLNTPRRVVFPSNNTVVWQWNGEPFGADQATGSGTYNLRFPGQYYDAETGKHYNYFRDYDPAMGRYIESDPIGLAGGLNTYGYVGGGPTNSIDPLGLMGNCGTANGVCGPIPQITPQQEQQSSPQRTEDLICLYLKNNKYNTEATWGDLYDARFTNRNKDPWDLGLRNAEHYMWAFNQVKNGRSQYGQNTATTMYFFYKTFYPRKTTPPAGGQLNWGYQGAEDGRNNKDWKLVCECQN